jgi:hypothetical protein
MIASRSWVCGVMSLTARVIRCTFLTLPVTMFGLLLWASVVYFVNLSSAAYFVLDLISGSAITIYGLVSSYSGNYSVTIDNITTSFSALSSFNDSNALLLFATDLSQDAPHTLVLTNTQNKTFGLSVGGMNVTTFGDATVNACVAFFILFFRC